jgi:polyketide cyclase/dehydrase/lipid transport protein
MAWKMEHSADSRARPEAVWKRYVDVDNWSEWSQKGVEQSHLDGEFEVGAEGMSKAPYLPKGKFELIAVEPEQRFASKSKLPGGTLVFEHVLEPTDGGTRITHRVTLDGPLTFLWSPLIGHIIKRGMPEGVERLAELAVEKEEEDREEVEKEKEHHARLEKADEQFKEEIERTSQGEGDRGGASVPGA